MSILIPNLTSKFQPHLMPELSNFCSTVGLTLNAAKVCDWSHMWRESFSTCLLFIPKSWAQSVILTVISMFQGLHIKNGTPAHRHFLFFLKYMYAILDLCIHSHHVWMPLTQCQSHRRSHLIAQCGCPEIAHLHSWISKWHRIYCGDEIVRWKSSISWCVSCNLQRHQTLIAVSDTKLQDEPHNKMEEPNYSCWRSFSRWSNECKTKIKQATWTERVDMVRAYDYVYFFNICMTPVWFPWFIRLLQFLSLPACCTWCRKPF